MNQGLSITGKKRRWFVCRWDDRPVSGAPHAYKIGWAQIDGTPTYKSGTEAARGAEELARQTGEALDRYAQSFLDFQKRFPKKP